MITSCVQRAASAAPRENSSSEIASDHRQVVVAGQADRAVVAASSHAGVGLGAVADEVAEAPQLVGVGGLDVGEHRLEGVAVAVDVGDDRDVHAGYQSIRCHDGCGACRSPSSPRWSSPRRRSLLLRPRDGARTPVAVDAASVLQRAPARPGARTSAAGSSWLFGGTLAIELGAARAARAPPAARGCAAASAAPVLAGAATGAALVASSLDVATLPLRASPASGPWTSGCHPGLGRLGAATSSRGDGDRRRARRRRRRAAGRRLMRRFGRALVAAGRGRGRRLRRDHRSTPARRARPDLQHASSRCPRASCAATCSSWRAAPASTSARSTWSTPPPDDGRQRLRHRPGHDQAGRALRQPARATSRPTRSRLVVAHELGHVHYRDVPRGLLFARARRARRDVRPSRA